MANYRDKDFLKKHALDLLEWEKPICRDLEYGGFYCTIKDTGEIVNSEYKELVSTARWILNFAFGKMMGGPEEYLDYIRHGLEFLEIAHRDDVYGGYHSVVIRNNPKIGNKLTYQAAFVFCAISNAVKAGVKEAVPIIDRVFDFMEKSIFDKRNNLYFDDLTNDYSEILPYRGQNCNMHMTEAMISAFESTRNIRFIERAYDIAYSVTKFLTKNTNGLIYEHYNNNWDVDFDYNKNADKYSIENLLRPYGFLPGHWVEWAKLLLLIERYNKADWLLETAEYLFTKAIEYSWDYKKGGMVYAVGVNKEIIDSDNHFWTHCEAISAAAALALRTGKTEYWKYYDMLWDFSDRYFVDHKNGGPWFRIIDNESKKPLSNIKLVPYITGYHTIGMCHDIIKSYDFFINKK